MFIKNMNSTKEAPKQKESPCFIFLEYSVPEHSLPTKKEIEIIHI